MVAATQPAVGATLVLRPPGKEPWKPMRGHKSTALRMPFWPLVPVAGMRVARYLSLRRAAPTGLPKRSDLTKERLAWLQRSEENRASAVCAVKLRQVLVASEEMAQEVHGRLRTDPDALTLLSGVSLEEGDVGWVGLEDSFLDEVLPLSVRQEALLAQPGDVLKVQSDKGWHVIRIEDVMFDLRVKRLNVEGSKNGGDVDVDVFDSKTYTVVTMGCQMNQADSERMEGQLKSLGMRPTPEDDHPDVVLLNTCSIREKAEKKVYARLDAHVQRKRQGQDVTLVVTGCVAQQEGEELLRAVPEVDVVMGPQFANRLADVLNESVLGGQICATEDARIMEDVTMPNRQSSISAWVNVIYGCNERCSYCVVPFTRGSEQSRPMTSIRQEVAQLVAEGYREVTLLGQNIDAYGRDFSPRRTFAELLRSLEDVGMERIRFLTSHPRYISEDLIRAVRDVPAVCEQFHIPFQSGDDEILRRMDRGYTNERYRRIAELIRSELPHAGLSADAIVGFPGETEEQFQRTVQLVEDIGFLTVNLAAYSPRPNTPAAELQDQVPEEVKKRRLQLLKETVLRSALEQSRKMKGQVMEMLVEGPHKSRHNVLRGRLRNGRICHVSGTKELIGHMVPVRITEAFSFSVTGEIVGEAY